MLNLAVAIILMVFSILLIVKNTVVCCTPEHKVYNCVSILCGTIAFSVGFNMLCTYFGLIFAC